MDRLRNAIGFLTRIPVRTNSSIRNDFYLCLKYFPVVGLILGIIYSLIFYVVEYFYDYSDYRYFVASIFIVIGSIILTGGLHYDGLADTFDAVFSYRDKSRILEIMKDSRVGTNAVLAIVVNILLKVSSMSIVFEQFDWAYIVVVPIISRTFLVILCAFGKNARKDGMGSSFIGKISKTFTMMTICIAEFCILMMIIILKRDFFSIIFFFVLTNISAIITGAILFIFIKMIYNKIGGITGDILGCVCEISETIFLLTVSMVIKFII